MIDGMLGFFVVFFLILNFFFFGLYAVKTILSIYFLVLFKPVKNSHMYHIHAKEHTVLVIETVIERC